MSAATETLAAVRPESIRGLTAVEFGWMVDTGLLDDEPVELLNGWLVRMNPQKSRHAFVVQWLDERLMGLPPPATMVRCQLPFQAGSRSVPEPDIAIVPRGSWLDRHPDRAFAIIEVAETTLTLDRTVKAGIYARASVPEYVIVNMIDRVLEVFRRPVGGRYTELRTLSADERWTADSLPTVSVRLADVLPA